MTPTETPAPPPALPYRVELLAAGGLGAVFRHPYKVRPDGTGTGADVLTEDERAVWAYVKHLEGVIQTAYPFLCGALGWAFDPNTNAAGDLSRALVALVGELGAAREESAKLQAFKAYVHQRLDAAGVPEEIPGNPHTLEGCRVGGRLDALLNQLAAARLVAEYERPGTPPLTPAEQPADAIEERLRQEAGGAPPADYKPAGNPSHEEEAAKAKPAKKGKK